MVYYFFFRHSLTEGYIHQFFYSFRYFTSAENLFRFLCDKLVAACMSLGPHADTPTKVKARAIDLLQVWIEGYFSVDFQPNPDLLHDCANFIQDKVHMHSASRDRVTS